MKDDKKKINSKELNDEELDAVSGGVNMQVRAAAHQVAADVNQVAAGINQVVSGVNQVAAGQEQISADMRQPIVSEVNNQNVSLNTLLRTKK